LTRKEFLALEKSLAAGLPGFAIKESLMLMTSATAPAWGELRGIKF
jgi:hypothetical protein